MSNKKDSISIELNKAVQEAEKHNSWFSNSSILNALSYWENKLNKNVLDAWINQYNFVNQNSKVAIIMACLIFEMGLISVQIFEMQI